MVVRACSLLLQPSSPSPPHRMWSTAREIAAGDVVIAWMTRDLIQPLVITPGKDLNSKYGYYRHEELVGIPYGSKVRSRNGKGFIHLLRPTPELWTLALPHRTQILYLADIAFVSSWLDIRPGSKVIEAGTGSGSFSHSVARTIGPSGHLWSYEFHEARASKAREEFTRHGMDDIVTLTHRNVCKDGFTVVDTVDAVFLDLPAPWDAVEHAKKALRVSFFFFFSQRVSLFRWCPPVAADVERVACNSMTERPHDADMLFQPVHGAGPPHRLRAQRRRLHRDHNVRDAPPPAPSRSCARAAAHPHGRRPAEARRGAPRGEASPPDRERAPRHRAARGEAQGRG
ncbi:tRNA methyltransferase complex GCD14 subunit-domain-containing protein [Trametes maxima]|nr:tRNA methyltransferase complex GCD14 subunit-domain-containing protein [Trametes maxima]